MDSEENIDKLLFWSQNKHFIVRKLLESNFYKLYTIPDQLIEETGLLKIVGVNFKKYSYYGIYKLTTPFYK